MSINTTGPLLQKMKGAGYIANEELAMVLQLMEQLDRPLLIEGEAGVGKTEVAKILATIKSCALIRLQCYEGLDNNAAAYEWNYGKQLLSLKTHEFNGGDKAFNIFDRAYLLERPLLQSILQQQQPVLLIDEIDRADEAFEAFLLELLSDFQITIPELGTLHAVTKPLVILTSNGTREISDALRRRCLYHYLDYPDLQQELAIVNLKIPQVAERLARDVVSFVQYLRRQNLVKSPGVAETLDWCSALCGLAVEQLVDQESIIYQTRGCILKTRDDQDSFRHEQITEAIQNIAIL